MVRSARKRAESEVYHVMTRGVGRQVIFEDDADRLFYLAVLSEELASHDGELLAWCLMDNHVHLLVRMRLEELSELMRALGSAYASFFNRRHDRVGHLFQDRFRSEPVESEAYLLTVVRYIHQNPVAAGLAPSCEYRWSSYRAYLGLPCEGVPTECDAVLSMLGGVDGFVDFHRALDDDAACIDVEERGVVSAERAREIAGVALGGVRVEEVFSLPRPERNRALRALRDARLSVRQIERLTGVSRGVISRV